MNMICTWDALMRLLYALICDISCSLSLIGLPFELGLYHVG